MPINYSNREISLTQKYELFSPSSLNVGIRTFGFGKSNSGWSGGVLAPNGKIYGIPQGNTILEIDPLVGTATTFSCSVTVSYVGGVVAKNGKIYCNSNTGNKVLEIDPISRNSTEISFINGAFSGNNAILSTNGKIYFSPKGTRVGIYNPITKSDSFITVSGLNGFNNCGTLAPNGKIYCISSNGGPLKILVIDPSDDTTSTISTTISSDYDSWRSAVLAQNGKIYGIPQSSTSILEIDTIAGTATTFGNVLGSAPTGNQSFGGRDGGVLGGDGKIYAAPQGSEAFNSGIKLLVIDPIQKTLNYVDIPYIYPVSTWIGGVLAPNGKIYFIPSSNNGFILEVGETTTTKPANSLLSPYMNVY